MEHGPITTIRRWRWVSVPWGYNPLTPPNLLQHEIALTEKSRQTVLQGRKEAVECSQELKLLETNYE
jgi:hypothetical protein